MYIHTLNEHLRRRFGRKIYKLSLTSGCTCPNRDGTLGERGCIFCDGAGAFAEHGNITEQLTAAKLRVADKAGENAGYIAYFQSFTNTYAPAEILRPIFYAAMEPEDVVVMLSDGVFLSFPGGEDALCGAIAALSWLHPQAIGEKLIAQALGGGEAADDMAVLCARVGKTLAQ